MNDSDWNDGAGAPARRDGSEEWRETLLQAGMLAFGALALEWVLFGRPLSAHTAHPHPYWVLVLPLAASRGLAGGVVGAALAVSLLTSAYILAEPSGGVEALARDALVFFAAAILVGELRESLRSRLAERESELADVKRELARRTYERDVLAETTTELERRLARGPSDLRGFIGAARRVDSGDVQELFDTTLDLVLEHVGDAASIVEVRSDGSLAIVAERSADGSQPTDVAELEHLPLIRRVLMTGEPISAFDLGEDLPAGPCIVAPLFDEGRRTAALLCLDDLAPTRLSPGTGAALFAIAEWASHGLSRIAVGSRPLAAATARAEATRSPRADAPRTSIGDASSLAGRLSGELARCRRHGINMVVLGLHVATDSADEERVDRLMLESVGHVLRDSDGLYGFGYPYCYALVLPGTDVAGAEVLRARLEASLVSVERRIEGHVSFERAAPELGALTAGALLDQLADAFRMHARRPLGLPERQAVPFDAAGDVERLVQRIACEAALSERFGFPFQILEVGVPDSPEREGALPTTLAAAARRTLRAGTDAYVLGDGSYAFVVAGADRVAGGAVAQRLVEALRSEGEEDEPHVDVIFDSEGALNAAMLVRTLRGGAAA